MIDLDVSVAHHHEVDLDRRDNTSVHKYGEKRDKDVVLVFPDAVVDLQVQMDDPAFLAFFSYPTE